MPTLFHTKSSPILLAVTIIVLLGTLFFGLRPKGFDFSNHVQWLKDRPGIHFEKYGLAYARLDKKLFEKGFSKASGFSIEIAIQPERFDTTGFKFILSIHDGNDQNQLLIGQWGSSLIVMNGDDYAHRKKTTRISVKIAPEPLKEIFLSITTGPKGTNLYVDGELAQFNPGLALQFPQGTQPKLTLGNSVYGKHSWQGGVFGLGLYGYKLAPATIESHCIYWSDKKNFMSLKGDRPSLLYFLNKKNGEKAIDHANGKYPLRIPSQMHLLKKTILEHPLPESGLTKYFIKDAAINLIGFIPLGFFLSAVVFQFSRGQKQAIMLSVLLCFGLSLTIEILQTWMPSRSSQSLDVILNTLGAILGALVYKLISRCKSADK